MIIRITVHDNDFSDFLVRFAQKFPIRIADHIRTDTKDPDILFEEYKKYNYYWSILNPNNDTKYTDEIKKDIVERVKEVFKSYCINSRIEDDTVKYLIKNFEVKIQSSFTDKWENGEAVYWLQHSCTVVNQ